MSDPCKALPSLDSTLVILMSDSSNNAAQTAANTLADELAKSEATASAKQNWCSAELASDSCAGAFMEYYRVCQPVVASVVGNMFAVHGADNQAQAVVAAWGRHMAKMRAFCALRKNNDGQS